VPFPYDAIHIIRNPPRWAREAHMDLKVEEAPDRARPKCPYCKHTLDKLWIMKKGLGVLEQKQVILCPSCESFLGYGVFGAR
jgi:hypothetical protein